MTQRDNLNAPDMNIYKCDEVRSCECVQMGYLNGRIMNNGYGECDEDAGGGQVYGCNESKYIFHVHLLLPRCTPFKV